jgi:hypothetical protein
VALHKILSAKGGITRQQRRHRQTTNKTKTTGMVAYLFIAFDLAWAVWISAWLLNVSGASQLFLDMSLLAGFAPALAAVIVRHALSS